MINNYNTEKKFNIHNVFELRFFSDFNYFLLFRITIIKSVRKTDNDGNIL